MTQHYGFFTSYANDLMHNQHSFIGSSTSPGHMSRGEIKGNGLYITQKNIKHIITLFSIRSLVKSTWCNSDNVYIGKE